MGHQVSRITSAFYFVSAFLAVTVTDLSGERKCLTCFSTSTSFISLYYFFVYFLNKLQVSVVSSEALKKYLLPLNCL